MTSGASDGQPAWQYLTLRVTRQREQSDYNWVVDSAHRAVYSEAIAAAHKSENPVAFLQEVLGPDGWELVACQPIVEENWGGGHYTLGAQLKEALYWFKRPAR